MYGANLSDDEQAAKLRKNRRGDFSGNIIKGPIGVALDLFKEA